MPSEVSLCNRALLFLGAAPIIALAEDSKAARLCQALYGDVRDAALRAYPWNCALRRAVLPALAGAPAFGFARAYQLPPDCLKVHAVDGNGAWRVEGRAILADAAPPLRIVYIARLLDPMLLDSLLAEALSAKLAVELAMNLTESPSRAEAAAAWFQRALAEARQTDAQEGAPEDLVAGTWLEARR